MTHFRLVSKSHPCPSHVSTTIREEKVVLLLRESMCQDLEQCCKGIVNDYEKEQNNSYDPVLQSSHRQLRERREQNCSTQNFKININIIMNIISIFEGFPCVMEHFHSNRQKDWPTVFYCMIRPCLIVNTFIDSLSWELLRMIQHAF